LKNEQAQRLCCQCSNLSDHKHGFKNLEESDNFEGANNHGVVDHA
jgi:hypothetical protein